MDNHSQTIERLNKRGGLDPTEFYAVAHGIAYNKIPSIEICIAWLESKYEINQKDADNE